MILEYDFLTINTGNQKGCPEASDLVKRSILSEKKKGTIHFNF